MARNTIYELSETDANNVNANTGLQSADSQAPSTLDNTDRGVMAFVAEMWADLTATDTPGTAKEAAGTANALTFTSNASFTTQAQGRRISLKATADNTGAATLAVNSLTAKKIRIMDPSGVDIDISAGMITDNGIYEFVYDEDLDTGSGGWLLLNPTRSGASAPLMMSFTDSVLNSLPVYSSPISQSSNSTESLIVAVVPVAGTLKNLIISVNTAPGSSETYTYTLRKNAADTSLTATISNTDTTASDTANTVAVAAGDLIAVKFTRSGSATDDARHRISLQITAT